MTSPTYDLSPVVLDRLTGSYRGAGDAMAAIGEDGVVALRYLDDYRVSLDDLPDWVRAVHNAAGELDRHLLPVARGARRLSAIARAASACTDCPVPPRRERYRPSELLSMARAVLAAHYGDARRDHMQRIMAELALFGRVVSGVAGSCQFVAHSADYEVGHSGDLPTEEETAS